jgi:hypothetical protein
VVANTLSGLTFIGPVNGKYERVSSRRELAAQLLDAVDSLVNARRGGTATNSRIEGAP